MRFILRRYDGIIYYSIFNIVFYCNDIIFFIQNN